MSDLDGYSTELKKRMCLDNVQIPYPGRVEGIPWTPQIYREFWVMWDELKGNYPRDQLSRVLCARMKNLKGYDVGIHVPAVLDQWQAREDAMNSMMAEEEAAEAEKEAEAQRQAADQSDTEARINAQTRTFF